MTAPIAVPEALVGVPFTTANAAEWGLSAMSLRGRRFRQLFAGVHISADRTMSLELWLQAARLVVPSDAVVTHLTGLRVRRITVGPRWPLHFASATQLRVRRERLHVCRVAQVPPPRHGVASAEDCFVAACADVDLVDAVTIGDQLVHREYTTMPRLREHADARRGRGARRARRAALLVRARAESPRETYLRLLLVLAGMPEPECNVNVGTTDAFIGRGDLVYAAYRLVVEYDGRQHAHVRQQWEDDLDRHDAFGASAWTVVRITARRLQAPRAVVRAVHARLVAQGYRGPAPVFDAAWVALFETTTAARRAWIALAGSWD